MLSALSGESGASHYALQIGSFCTLVAVQSTALLLFKVCQVQGSYTFSPASNVALTEMCKLGLAGSLHISATNKARAEGSPSKGYLDGLSLRIVLHYLGLAVLYTVNNQLTFLCFELADPGSYALGKSVAPYLCAVLLRLSGDKLNALQWACIVLQCSGIAVTQYDPCKHTGYLPTRAYMLIALSTLITAVSSVWNQKVVKGFDVPVNLQNSVLYVFGSLIAILSFWNGAMNPTKGPKEIGFFEGYTWLAVALVIWQAFHGLAVTLVYKYADAIVKNFANSSVMAILVVLSVYFFNLTSNLDSWLGVMSVLVTTWVYMNIAIKMPKEAAAVAPSEEKSGLLKG